MRGGRPACPPHSITEVVPLSRTGTPKAMRRPCTPSASLPPRPLARTSLLSKANPLRCHIGTPSLPPSDPPSTTDGGLKRLHKAKAGLRCSAWSPRLQGLSPAGPYLQPMVQPAHAMNRAPSHNSPSQVHYQTFPPPERATPMNQRALYTARSTDDLRKLHQYRSDGPLPPVPPLPVNARPQLPFPGQPPQGYLADPRGPGQGQIPRPASARPGNPSPQMRQGSSQQPMPSYSAAPILQHTGQPVRPIPQVGPSVPPPLIRTDLPPNPSHGMMRQPSQPPPQNSPYDYQVPRYDVPRPIPGPSQRSRTQPQANYSHHINLEPGGTLQQAMHSPAGTSSNNVAPSYSNTSPRMPPQNQFMSYTDPSTRRHDSHAREASEPPHRSPSRTPDPAQPRGPSPENGWQPSRSQSRQHSKSASLSSSRSASSHRSKPSYDEKDAYGGTFLADDAENRSESPRPIVSPPIDSESRPPLHVQQVEPSAPDLWEDDVAGHACASSAEQGSAGEGTVKAAKAMLEFSEEDTGTVKAEEWADLVRMIGQVGDDTPPATLRKDGLAIVPVVEPIQSAPKKSFTFQDDDDDDEDDNDDGATWARPMQSALKLPEPAGDASPLGTSPKPSLKVQIEELQVPSSVPSHARNSSLTTSRSGSSPSPGLFSAKDTDDQWAVRPDVDRVYDELDKFFPGHDLDKEIVDAGVTSPSVSMTTAVPAVEPAPVQKFKHKKSIRIIAQDRRRLLQKTEVAPKKGITETVTSLLRRKSTKLWGTRTEEVKAGKFAPISENPSPSYPDSCGS